MAIDRLLLIGWNKLVDKSFRFDRLLRVEQRRIGNPLVDLLGHVAGQRLKCPFAVPQGLDGRDERSTPLLGRRHLIHIHAEMLGQQPVPETRNICTAWLGFGGFHGEVAFRIEPHGAIAQIGRAHPGNAVVDDHDLGMHHEGIDEGLSGRDTLHVKPLDLANFVATAIIRQGACNAECHLFQVRRDAGRPGVAISIQVRVRGVLPHGRPPALAHQLPYGHRRLAVDRHLHVVKRRIRFAVRVHAAFIIRKMARRVPTPLAQIQPTDEGHPIVHHHDLLMLGSTDRMLAVEGKMNPLV